MNATAFVESLVDRAFRSAIAATLSRLESPPGLAPSPDLLSASAWYLGLSAGDRHMVRWIVKSAAHSAVFGTLAVIDGERLTGPYRYEVTAVEADGSRSLLNAESGEDLHDIFQDLITLPDGSVRD